MNEQASGRRIDPWVAFCLSSIYGIGTRIGAKWRRPESRRRYRVHRKFHGYARLDARVEHTTTRATHFMSIQLRCSPSRLFENKLSGTAWIGDVSFIASDGAAPPNSK